MKIRVVSDLHFEFHADGGKSFVDSMDPSGIDLLILAGDISNTTGIQRALKLLGKHFKDTAVVFTAGNHEYYGGSKNLTDLQIHKAVKATPNLHWLSNDIFEHQGRRILGTTLWFYKTRVSTDGMNDFVCIHDFESWVYEENRKAIEFLKRELREGDIVVTHYLPTPECVAERFRGHALNAFFLCDVKHLIEERKPALWCFGHTHDSMDLTVGETRLVCNPYGYARIGENPRFSETLTVEV